MVARLGVKNAVQAALVACGAAASLPAMSLGLGEIEMQSFLNEPLRAEVELLDTRQLNVDDIRIRLAGGDDFDRMGVERSFFLTSIQFEVEVDDASGRGVIRLRTDEAVLEPYLDLIIEARWPSGRLLREYTVLIDPPAFRQEMLTVSASESVAAQVPDSPAPAAAQSTLDSDTQSETSGDRIRRRESTLAPGEMPARAFSAETREVPRAGNRYMVRRDETLWQIARQGRPEAVSVQQAMLDIQRLNPEAFINGNINRIKAGYIIYLPEAGDISSDDLARALDEVREQNQEWQASRDIPGVTAAATLRVSADTDTAETSAGSLQSSASLGSGRSAEEQGMQAESLASSASDGVERLEADTSAVEENADSAAARVSAQLESMVQRLDTLEQIVALKDEQIATLEQALRESREAASSSSAAPAVAQVTRPADPVTRPAPKPAPAAKSSIPWLPLGGGVLVLALAGLFFMRRRAASADDASPENTAVASGRAEDDVFAGVSLKREALADPAEPAPPVEKSDIEEPVDPEVDDPKSDALETAPPEEATANAGGSRGYGERKHDDYIDEAAGGDALAEADIYIAYGRYLQAIELLDSAIASEPGNSAYRVKLIELYVDMGEIESASAQLEALREHGDVAAIERGEALLGGGGGPVEGDVLETPVVPPREPQVDAPDIAEESADVAEASALADASVDDQESTAEDLELDLDALGSDLTDIDALDMGDIESADAAESVGALDLDDIGDQVSLGEVEFDDLEIEEDSAGVSEEEDRGFAEHIGFAGEEEELDLSDALSEGIGELDATADSEAGEDLLIAEDADQMATKLDLARAYIDMGDSSGARTILEEVASGGSDEQQVEARDLISKMS